jgi:transposase-like protein
MAESDRLGECIAWIDLSFVERERTPEWAIQVDIRYHLTFILAKNVSQFIETLGIEQSHLAIHNWVHKAVLQPISTVSADQLAIDEKVIRIDGDDCWLYGTVDPETNEILQLRLFPTTKQTTRWFLADLHRRYRLDDVEFLVDAAD